MFQEPKKYTANDHFFYEAKNSLEAECTAPKDAEGAFKVLELRNGKIDVVYFGCSAGNGLFDEIVNGLHYDGNPRVNAWPRQLLNDKTDALDVYWYVTGSAESAKKALVHMITDYRNGMRTVPKWNKLLL